MTESLRQLGLHHLDDLPGPARPISDQRARELVRGALSRVIAGEGETRTRPRPGPRLPPPGRRLARVALVAGTLLAGSAAVAGLAYRALGLGWKAAAPPPATSPPAAAERAPGAGPPAPAEQQAVDAPAPTLAATPPAADDDRAAHLPAHRKALLPRSHALLQPGVRTPAGASADDLLSRANQLRAQRRWQEAAAAYQAVIAGSSETHAAYVAMLARAELLLDHLARPAEALGLFQRALAEPAGVLTEEARYGLAACYRALGDVENERRALNVFLAAHPHSLMRVSAAARLGELH